MASQVNTATYFDEEDCLGLEVFLAELELVVGARRDKFDQVALLELLPKLAATIAKTDRATLKQHQRRCEAAFQELLHQGMSMPVSEGRAAAGQQQGAQAHQLQQLRTREHARQLWPADPCIALNLKPCSHQFTWEHTALQRCLPL